MRKGMRGILGAALPLAVAALAALPAGGIAETVDTIGEYTALAEPICKKNVQANKRIFKGAKGKVKAGKLKPASRHFLRAASAFGKTIRELAAVPRPPDHDAKLRRWLGLLRAERSIVQKIGRALKSGQKHKAESFSVELNRNSNKANNTVLAFGFDYCRIEPSRFG